MDLCERYWGHREMDQRHLGPNVSDAQSGTTAIFLSDLCGSVHGPHAECLLVKAIATRFQLLFNVRCRSTARIRTWGVESSLHPSSTSAARGGTRHDPNDEREASRSRLIRLMFT
jgi:hypothetical protein